MLAFMSGINSLAASGINVQYLLGTNSGGFDYSIFTKGASSSGTGQVYGTGDVGTALKNAEANEAKQLAQVAKQPDVQRDLARYEKVLKNAKTLDDVLADPVAREVLLKANGLGDQINYIGLAKKALASDPTSATSVAAKLSSINGAWLAFARKYDIAHNGLDALRPNTDGLKGDWAVAFTRDGEAIEGELKIRQVKGAWGATLDGVPIPVKVESGTITLDYLWNDDAGDVHTTRLTGKVGKDLNLSGAQINDGLDAGSWKATPAAAAAIKEIGDNYVAEKRLDMLDAQLPGLGSAVLFKQMAATLDTPIKILGSAIGREVIGTAFNIPKQVAIQSIPTQEKVFREKLDPKNLADPKFVDRLVQRYLLNVNGGTSGVTA